MESGCAHGDARPDLHPKLPGPFFGALDHRFRQCPHKTQTKAKRCSASVRSRSNANDASPSGHSAYVTGRHG